VIANALRAQNDPAAVKIDVVVYVNQGVGAERQGCSRGAQKFARFEHINHPILDDFGVGG
jgi:hypothetical protein